MVSVVLLCYMARAAQVDRSMLGGGGGGGCILFQYLSPYVVHCLFQANVGIAATIGVMDAANAVAVEWGLGVPTPGVLDEVQTIGVSNVVGFCVLLRDALATW